MAKKKVVELKKKSRLDAFKILRENEGFPVPPRKAMSQAKKATKMLGYPVAPYTNTNPIQLFNWAKQEWGKLGRWQSLATPVVLLVGLLTWQKEQAVQEEYMGNSEKAKARRLAAQIYRVAEEPKRKRKLLGIIPLPGGK
jgi:hypothetical protein